MAMPLWKTVKSFLVKEKYDFEKSEITLYDFHPQVRIFYMINGIFFENKNSLARFFLPFLNTSLSLVGFAFEGLYIYHGLTLKDYAIASECFSYTMILGTIPIVYCTTLYNRDIIVEQLEKMNKDFLFFSKMESKYRDLFLKGQTIIWALCWMWIVFCWFVSGLFIANAMVLLLYQSLIAQENEDQIRPLIFPLWMPKDDPYRTPNYEILMLVQILLIFAVDQNFAVYVYMLFHVLIHYYNLMDMIILDLEVIFDGLDDRVVDLPRDDPRRVEVQLELNSRMRRIVEWHKAVYKSVTTIAKIYGPPLVYQVMFSSMAICIMAYQVADQLEQGKIHYLFAFLLIACCLQLWIPCYLGTLIRNKAFSVSDACWNCGWHKTKLGRMLRVDIVTFILRAQQPLTIQFTGLPNLTLETFSSIMSTSYSYFNMLRQSTKS